MKLCHNFIHNKPEVHNVSQRRQGRTEPRSQKLVKFGRVVSEICELEDRQKDRQTDMLNTIPRTPPEGEAT